MSAPLRMKIGVVAAGLSCLVMGYAWAQQVVTEREIEREGSSVIRTEPTADQPAGQIDRSQLQQGQRYTANFRGAQAGAGAEQEVQHYLANCLLSKNQAEVEIGQIAARQSQNPEVKQFAQTMVQDHQKLAQQLQTLAGAARGSSASLNATGQLDADRRATDTTRAPGSPGANQRTAANENINANRDTNQPLTGPAGQNAALQQLASIETQIGERCKQALREELEQKQGAEFDKCYIGSQVAGHMHMLAALEVLEQQGPDQLKQLAQQARPQVQQHLEHAKQIMKQLDEGANATSSQAERQQPRTQR